MQRNEAMKWFWPFLSVAAVAVWVSALVQTKMPSTAPPEPQLLIAASREAPHVGARHVTIEPSHIEVIGTRSTSQLQARAGQPSRRKQAG